MQLYDPELYDLWVLITRGDVQQPSQFIANRFHAQYVHSDLKHGDFLRKAEQDPGFFMKCTAMTRRWFLK